MEQTQIDPQTQKRLNDPLAKPAGISQEDQSFLDLVVAKVEKGEINLMQPSSLINKKVYDELGPDKQGKVDFDAVNLLTTLRNIYDLWKIYHQPTFQIENLVRQVRLTKERLEEISGDVYVI
ncbi:hypothetical protein HYW83_01200 [Candidatus Peregrinibacteria bacterium]|nr:hypothetical protein [Candidatus Peregrinibacteria bacterium]